MLRVFHHYFSARKAALFVTESLAIAVAGVFGAALMATLLNPSGVRISASHATPLLLALSGALVAVFQFALYAGDLYDLKVAEEDRARGTRFVRAAGVSVIVIAALATLSPVVFPPGMILGAVAGAITATVLVRTAMPSVLGEPARVLIIGNGVKAMSVVNAVEEGGENAFRIVSMIEPPRLDTAGGATESLEDIARRLKCEYIIVACDEARGIRWVDELIRCRFEGRQVYESAAFCERVLRRIPVAHVRPSEFAFADELRFSKLNAFFKRTFDILMASILFIAALPIMGLVALAVRLDSRGPIFYRQERVGKNGRNFSLIKFRSMRTDAEKDGAVWARANDDRVTRVGRIIRKTRMDEIPQVINVLLGDMSFVGPRPERPVFVRQLEEQIPFFKLRSFVKPGITGWAQIRYPYGASVEDARNKLEFDLYYVKNGSIALDLAICFHTARHVLLGRGAR
jgi:sugar transferase (PEP-CTERM system associated)